MSDLQRQVLLLEEQLRLARQKASLYYIAVSELESLKRSHQTSDIVRKEASTCIELTHLSAFCFNKSTQTDSSSSDVDLENERRELIQENQSLKRETDSFARTQRSRITLKNRLVEIVNQPLDQPGSDKSQIQFLIQEYGQLFEDLLNQNRESVNHSIEIKRRDTMISSLFEKIRLMESAFTQKLFHAESIAASRLQVIQELGNQVKEAVQISSSYEATFEIGALHAELEDLRAELSMARSNWAATRDELLRLQFRVGADGNGSSDSTRCGFPAPVLSLENKPGVSIGVLSGIRKIRKKPQQEPT